MTPIKTLMVGMDWFPYQAGGLNRYFYDMVHALPEVDICGSALLGYVGPDAKAPLTLQGIADREAGLLSQLIGARRSAKEALKQKPDVVNTHFAKFTYPWLANIPQGVPLIVNFHGPWADELAVEVPGPGGRMRAVLARHIEMCVYRRGTRFITLSKSFREILHSRYGVPLDRIHIVPPGINLNLFNSAPERGTAREILGWPVNRPILLSVRRVVRRMGLELLIDAIDIVRQSVPNCLLLIAGKGAMESEIDQRIERLGLGDHVRRIGFVPDHLLPTAYAAADISVVPSVTLEGFGLSTVESLASGTPVLGTNIGGTSEILTDLQADLLFCAVTRDAIADRLVTALSDASALPDRTACRRYAARYHWPLIARQIRSVYDDALTNRGVRG